jgi:hypothetical protein
MTAIHRAGGFGPTAAWPFRLFGFVGRNWNALGQPVKGARPSVAPPEPSERQLADTGLPPRSQLDPERIDRTLRLLALGACLSGGWFFWDASEHTATFSASAASSTS